MELLDYVTREKTKKQKTPQFFPVKLKSAATIQSVSSKNSQDVSHAHPHPREHALLRVR
jgi:hypothetical protein